MTNTIDPDAHCNESHPQVLTAETITDEQIRALKSEAIESDDDRQRAICDLALGYAYASIGPRFARLEMSQAVARQRCADAINKARAQAGT